MEYKLFDLAKYCMKSPVSVCKHMIPKGTCMHSGLKVVPRSQAPVLPAPLLLPECYNNGCHCPLHICFPQVRHRQDSFSSFNGMFLSATRDHDGVIVHYIDKTIF